MLKQQAMSKWIDVKERLPKDDEMYIVFGEETVSCAFYIPDEESFAMVSLENADFIELFNRVTHWMPLPKKPKT